MVKSVFKLFIFFPVHVVHSFMHGGKSFQYIIAYADLSGESNYQYGVGFPDVFPNYEPVHSNKTWKLSFSRFLFPLKLCRTPFNKTTTQY